MIYVKRCATPEVFVKKRDKIREEIEKAKAFFAGPDAEKCSDKLFKFYKSQSKNYKEMLITMFCNRCAYCESDARVGQRGDIEHFRPKGMVVNKDGGIVRPGYFWMAADWDNLYLSCVNCNQQSSFKIIDANDPSQVKVKPIGKKNHFPLSDESFRVNYRRRLRLREREEPYRLLLDPCHDDPEQFLTFTEAGIVKPKGNDQRAVDMATYSINIYGLQREELVTERLETYLRLREKTGRLQTYTPLVIDGIKAGDTSVQHRANYSAVQQDFSLLMNMLDAGRPQSRYLALCRQHAGPFLNAHLRLVKTVLQANNKQYAWYQQAVDYFKPQVLAMKKYFENKTVC